jgi:hypothetical protein
MSRARGELRAGRVPRAKTAARPWVPASAALLASLLFAPGALAGSVDTVAQEAAQALGQTPSSSVVVAAPLVSDQPAPRGEELALRIAALVAGKLGAGARANPQPAQLATARAIAGRASALVYVQTEVSRGDLRTTIDVYPSMSNAWDRIRNPLPSPTGHAFATTKIDAETRTFLAPLVLEQASLHRAKHDEGEVLAVACGDVDGDGGDEIALVSRTRVAMGRVRGGKFVVEHAAPWTTLSARAAIPAREALAGAVVTRGAVDVGTTDRASLALTGDFVGHALLSGIPAWGGEGPVCLLPEPSAGAFDGAPFDCTPSRDLRPRLAVPAPRFDAFAATSVVDVAGAARSVVVVREPSGKLHIKAGDVTAEPDGTFGAQLAVLDFDQDGVADVATSGEGTDDAVNLWTWPGPGPELHGRLHLAAPAGVRAIAACPPEENGEPVLVAVVGAEVWLIRAGMRGAASTRGEATSVKRSAR